MALRRISGPDAVEDSGLSPGVPFATVLNVNGKLTSVTLIDPPPRDPHTGACACEACRATRLADLAIRFY